MSLVSEQLPNLMNGVSQQAVTMRMGSQGEEQINAVSSVVRGNTKRPPLVHHSGRISEQNNFESTHVHVINRDSEEQYIVIVGNSFVSVYDVDGNPQTVKYADADGNEVDSSAGTAYLTPGGDPSEKFSTITVADYTFILNTNVKVEKGTKRSPSQPYWGQTFLQALSYDTTYEIDIDGVTVASHTTPLDSGLDTDIILSALASNTATDQWELEKKINPNAVPSSGVVDVSWGLISPSLIRVESNGNPVAFEHTTAGQITITGSYQDFYKLKIYRNRGVPVSADFDFQIYQSIMHIEREDGGEFQLSAGDNKGGQMINAILPKMERFTDLPVVGKDGYVVEIVGDDEVDGDSYFLGFTPNNSGQEFDTGYWIETVAPDTPVEIDKTTMPHVLIRESDGTFTFKPQEWGERVVGDEDSAPWPSFVGREINDIYFDRNRLCIVADDNVTMSRDREFFSFFPKTVTTILDTGPIDVSAATTSVAILRHALPFNKSILFFADQSQFEMRTPALLASQPPSIDLITSFDNESGAKPVGAGRTVFFTSDSGKYASMMEYYVMDDTDTTDAANITDHVPSYIPSGVHKLASNELTDTLMVLTKGERNAVYVYRYLWQGTEKKQSSWSKWLFEPEAMIISADFIKDTCYFLIQYPDGLYIEKMSMSDNVDDAEDGEGFVYRLDRRVTEGDCIAVSNSSFQKTTVTLPFKANSGEVRVVTRYGDGTSTLPPAKVITHTDVTQEGDSFTKLECSGDLSNVKFYVGVEYDHVYTFSEPTLKGRSQSGGMATLAAGRLQLKRWHVFYDNTGHTRAEVKIKNRDKYTYTLNGATLGTGDFTLGEVPIGSGKFSFRVNSRSDRVKVSLINPSFLPSTFTAAEWEGRFNRNTSRG